MVPYAKMPIFNAPNASNAVGVAVPLDFLMKDTGQDHEHCVFLLLFLN